MKYPITGIFNLKALKKQGLDYKQWTLPGFYKSAIGKKV